MSGERESRRGFARPLWFAFNVAPSVLLPAIGTAAYDPALRAILAQAQAEAESDPEGGWIHYSRRKIWYAENRRYLHEEQTYTNVLRAIDIAEKQGLIEHRKAAPGQLGEQSKFRASRRLLAIMPAKSVLELQEPAEVIVLKERGKSKTRNNAEQPPRRIPYDDTDETRRMRRSLIEINEAIASVKLAHPTIGIIHPGTPTRIGDCNPGLAMNRLVRIFTESFDFHGRFYGWWQNWPARERAALLFDGKPVIEHDYRQIHPTLLYARRGIELPADFDAYTIDGVPKGMRPLLKVVFNAVVNARSPRGLHLTIRDKAAQLARDGEIPSGFDPRRIRDLMAAIREQHVTIADAFFSDAGMTLMRIDSDIAETVMQRLLRKGIVPLPVHDSFIVQAAHGGVLREIMDDVLIAKLADLGSHNIVHVNFRSKTEREQINILKQNGYLVTVPYR